MQLAAQSIRRLCVEVYPPMVTPFVEEKQVVNGPRWRQRWRERNKLITIDLKA